MQNESRISITQSNHGEQVFNLKRLPNQLKRKAIKIARISWGCFMIRRCVCICLFNINETLVFDVVFYVPCLRVRTRDET